jgi:hypothetical protein
MRFILTSAATYVAALVVSTAAAQTGHLTFPPILVEQSVNSGRAMMIRDTPVSYMGYYDESIYAGQATQPVHIVGFQMRLAIGNNWRAPGYSASSWPAETFTMPEYEVWLGKGGAAVSQANWFFPITGQNLPFTSHMRDAVQVRSGALSVEQGSFQATGGSSGIHAWGPTIGFDEPYRFEPGQNLVMLVRHGGIAEPNVIGALMASRYNAPSYVDAMVAFGSTATHPLGLTDPHYVRFVTTPIPEPASLIILMAASALAVRRQSR